MTAQRTLAVMVCSHCGKTDCHEGKRVSLSQFSDLADAGIFLDDAGAVNRHSVVANNEHDADFHEHDANAQWKSPSRKIIEAEITGYEVELAGLLGSDSSFDHESIEVVEGKIEALKLLATKFD